MTHLGPETPRLTCGCENAQTCSISVGRMHDAASPRLGCAVHVTTQRFLAGGSVPDVDRRQRGRGLGVALHEVRVLNRAGVVDVRRPDRIMRQARQLRRLGPIAGGVRAGAQRCPLSVALIDRGLEFTYDELDQITNAVARQWAVEGITDASTVAVLGRDSADLVVAMAAAGKIGARLVLMNTGFGGRQLRDVSDREGVSAFVYDDEFADRLAQLPTHKRLSAITQTALETGDTRPPPRPQSQGRLVLLTGGTTGVPKGAARRVSSPLAAAQFVDRVPLRRGQTILLCAPLFHGTALSQFIIGLNLGLTIVVHGPRFDPALAVEQLGRYECDAVVLVPTMLRRIVDLGEQFIAGHDTRALKIVLSAGSALPASLGDDATALFGPCIYNLYGSTETGTATVATPEDWKAAPGTVGKPPVGIAVALYDGDARVTTPGVKGTVHVGNSLAFDGYSGGGSKPTKAGFMSTGDVGHWDSQGLLFIDGRDDDMIVSGGENVFPGEVESLLTAHPAVAEASVDGVPDDEFGQRLAAFVVLRSELTEGDVQRYVREHLARYKVPRDVVFLSDLPRTATGKVDRRGIRAAHKDWLTAQRRSRTLGDPEQER
ncbi:AMP-binding protein [Williamsia sp. SKLECPSW1]